MKNLIAFRGSIFISVASEEYHRESSYGLIGQNTLTLKIAVFVTLTGMYGVGGTAVRLAAAVIEGSVMINIVTTLDTCPFTVDKNKSKANSCQQHHQQQASQPNQSNGPPDVVPASVAEVERKNHTIQQLKGQLAASNCRFEAIAVVLQQTLAKVRKCLYTKKGIFILYYATWINPNHFSDKLFLKRDNF